eukprot:CAMPEP_0178754174 /NCGR_PEP_ID=MMETSP0744-20121128/12019_1 /TAXON_ID=913974 /ORGANISM="Nitzschia punctata, Strain CCMP561" /LENGTH=565 /DNA_ID=CAMNT_0020408069 /DNA_START=1091 /DNA_END=2788 /DNA_ORIENTATION=-
MNGPAIRSRAIGRPSNNQQHDDVLLGEGSNNGSDTPTGAKRHGNHRRRNHVNVLCGGLISLAGILLWMNHFHEMMSAEEYYNLYYKHDFNSVRENQDVVASASSSSSSTPPPPPPPPVAVPSSVAAKPFAETNVAVATSKKTSSSPKTIAYAVSFIECTDHHKSGQSSIAGLIDASLVLRHSIHMNSIRNPASSSKYDYHMYALVHKTKAASCAPALERAGFTILLVEPPLSAKDIRGDELRKKIHREVCCGADEFIKLYAYTHMSHHPLVVHLDIDFLFQKPMDDIFDVMLWNEDSGGDPTVLEATKARIEREDDTDPWPSDIQAMMVRDYHSSFGQGRKSGFQAGFWVLKPSQTHYNKLIEIIREGNYTGGFGRDNGWGGLGYGGFVGAMAMQGLVAYYYDVFVPGTWVELNNCRHNSVSASIFKNGKCKSGRPHCEDCRFTPVANITSIHYTACRKPWTCIATKTSDPNNSFPRKYSIPVDIVDYDHCMELQAVWHDMRADLENKLYALTKDERIAGGQKGTYNQQFFRGHCSEDQSKGYLSIAGGVEEILQRIPDLYSTTT